MTIKRIALVLLCLMSGTAMAEGPKSPSGKISNSCMNTFRRGAGA